MKEKILIYLIQNYVISIEEKTKQKNPLCFCNVRTLIVKSNNNIILRPVLKCNGIMCFDRAISHECLAATGFAHCVYYANCERFHFFTSPIHHQYLPD